MSAISKSATILAMADPQPGDRFTEFFSFWVYVVKRDGNTITTIEANSPAILPQDGEIKVQTLEEFRERFHYQTRPGYWVRLVDRNNDVEGWLEVCSG